MTGAIHLEIEEKNQDRVISCMKLDEIMRSKVLSCKLSSLCYLNTEHIFAGKQIDFKGLI